MRRFLHLVLMSLLAVAILVPAVGAQVSGLADADTYVSSQDDVNHDAADLVIAGSSLGGPCNATGTTTYMRWDLTGLAQTPTYASLTLTAAATALSTQAGGQSITLYRLADAADTWSENMLFAAAPQPGPAIQTVTLPTTADGRIPQGQAVVFGGTDGALLTYILDELDSTDGDGNNIAGFALRFATCSLISTQAFEDSESGVQGPQLLLTATGGPTAVEVSSASAQKMSAWPFYVGLAGIAAVVVAGIVISRRRTA